MKENSTMMLKRKIINISNYNRNNLKKRNLKNGKITTMQELLMKIKNKGTNSINRG